MLAAAIPAKLYTPDALPEPLRALITVADKPHPQLGTPCWYCKGELNRNGYIRVRWNGKRRMSHKVTYNELVGEIPPERPILDHLCKNRPCCSPNHTEPVTHQVNTLRGDAILFKPRFECAAVTAMPAP